MKVISSLLLALICACISACVPVPTVTPTPSVEALRQGIPQAAQGDDARMVKLADSFQWGNGGLGRDETTRMRYLNTAAEHGNAEAQVVLARIAMRGNNDLLLAAYWAHSAATLGNRNAYWLLRELYANKTFPLYDLAESCKWQLVAGGICQTANYSEADIAEAKKRMQDSINANRKQP
ncbi:MAG TPA: hypothetical protein VL381_10750 [Rhodocyclaceae bacterium]|jgi:hypothetical protein|nr:hypothetical protein [Rhodocyclaceae bacterium]